MSTQRLRLLCFVVLMSHVACSIPNTGTVSARARALLLPLQDQFPASAESIMDMRGDYFPGWARRLPMHAKVHLNSLRGEKGDAQYRNTHSRISVWEARASFADGMDGDVR